MEFVIEDRMEGSVVTEDEINWMTSKRSIEKFDGDQFVRDYGESEYLLTCNLFSEIDKSGIFTGCLNWPGVGTRWKDFGEYLKNALQSGDPPKTSLEAFKGYANKLGRVTSYRALSLTPEQYETIKNADSIWPSGRLRTTAEELHSIINQNGVKLIAYARLYIGLRLVKFDPSLSLHDDGETAVCIAGGYMDIVNNKKIHLFEVSVPKIEALGYAVADIQDGEKTWFKHRGIWFNSKWERTERYMLWEIPFLSARLKKLRIFESDQEIMEYLLPFKDKMIALRKRDLVLGGEN
eukprot:TRINITY_DN3352_c0_g1_i2.p1 TRINITY_DN3352_c0_g1~~TRINITY_DN3352_c0_g1_i2.p1  ORF type:complete len:293 (+),score=33.51 TRINITY_DN3352_c0_g1_i2:1395-2273(+)